MNPRQRDVAELEGVLRANGDEATTETDELLTNLIGRVVADIVFMAVDAVFTEARLTQ